MSLNNNLFGFNNQYDENVAELKMEINDLYKKRDKKRQHNKDLAQGLEQRKTLIYYYLYQHHPSNKLVIFITVTS